MRLAPCQLFGKLEHKRQLERVKAHSLEWQMGLLDAIVANFLLRPDKPFETEDCMPSRWGERRGKGTKRAMKLRKRQAAENIRRQCTALFEA